MKSLKLTLPIGQVLFQSIAWLLLFCGSVELFSRTPAGRSFFHYESYGSAHPHFDTQIIRIKDRVAQEGHIDCIFLGDSQILHGIDPAIVEKTYFEKTGSSIKCQNFGLGGLKPHSTGEISRILIKNFSPSVIIYGTDLFDYANTFDGSGTSIMSSPWSRYQLGEFSIDGWLIENSNSYRYYLGIDRFFPDEDENIIFVEPNGHSTKFSEISSRTQAEQFEYFSNIITRNPKITEQELLGLRDLLSLADQVKIIVIETPLHPAYFDREIFPYNARFYPHFTNILANETSQADAELWLTQETFQAPPDGWFDVVHLNKIGAASFSRSLGEYLADIIIIPTGTTR
jgi:hypothetical protein